MADCSDAPGRLAMSQAKELSARRMSAGVMPAACSVEMISALRFAMVMATLLASEGAAGAGGGRGRGRRIGLDGWVEMAVGLSVGAGDDRRLLAVHHLLANVQENTHRNNL